MTTAPVNRIKHYINAPQTSTPSGAVGYYNVVQCALATMARLMTSIDNDVAFNAASAVLEIEKARLRHKMPVAGVQQLDAPREPEPQPQELNDEQTKQFEKAVDEFTVVMNRKQVQDGLPEFDRPSVRGVYMLKLKELGLAKFLSWHEWMMGSNTNSGDTHGCDDEKFDPRTERSPCSASGTRLGE
jgi:hypothetical protein